MMEQLIHICDLYNESVSSCMSILKYLTTQGWSEEEAIPHVIGLVKDGWFKEVRALCKTHLS